MPTDKFTLYFFVPSLCFFDRFFFLRIMVNFLRKVRVCVYFVEVMEEERREVAEKELNSRRGQN